MSDSLEVLGAKQAITEVLYRYCHAVDRMDPHLGSEVWHADGLAHYDGIFEGTGQDLIDFVLLSHSGAEATSHQVANVLIEIDGDRATSESYVTACIRAKGTDIVVRGRYSDRWSCRADRWRIDERHYRHDIVQVVPVAEASPSAPDEPV